MEILVRDRQNIYDIALQYFGDLNFVGQIIRDNDLTWSSPLTVGQKLIINNESQGNQEVKNGYSLNNLNVINGPVVTAREEAPTWDQTSPTWDDTNATFDLK